MYHKQSQLFPPSLSGNICPIIVSWGVSSQRPRPVAAFGRLTGPQVKALGHIFPRGEWGEICFFSLFFRFGKAPCIYAPIYRCQTYFFWRRSFVSALRRLDEHERASKHKINDLQNPGIPGHAGRRLG